MTGSGRDTTGDGGSELAEGRLVVTGTPGTGKTTATDLLADERDLTVVHLNDLIREEGLYTERDEERDSLVADLDAIAERLGDRPGGGEDKHEDGRPGGGGNEHGDDRTHVEVVESHLAHYLAADRVAVLRCRPDELERRLSERGEDAASARENRESEALDVVLGEAVERHGEERVYEIDTTDRDPGAVAAELGRVLDGDREPSAGEVDFVEYV